MLKRDLGTIINQLKKQAPVLAIVGPRQSGKSTLCKMLFPKYKYLSLENIDIREEALSDPRQFLASHKKVVIDEIQRVPELLSYMQEIVDNESQKNYPKFVITGSQQFLFLEKVTQSLAGRISLFKLYPLTFSEILQKKQITLQRSIQNLTTNKWEKLNVEKQILKGGYPRLYREKLISSRWASDYITTYIEKDLRQIVNIVDLRQFEIFLKLLASHCGQLLNYSNLSGAVGVSLPTIKRWISLLETSGLIFTLAPHYKNFKKRMIKTSKIYFIDTLILTKLLEINEISTLKNSPLFGHIFENFIIADIWKRYQHQGIKPPLYFWRNKSGDEIDLVIDENNQLFPIEIKSSTTMSESFRENIKKWFKFAGNTQKNGLVIYRGKNLHFKDSEIPIIPWNFV